MSTTITISDDSVELLLCVLYEQVSQFSDPDDPTQDYSQEISLLQNVIDELEINRG